MLENQGDLSARIEKLRKEIWWKMKTEALSVRDFPSCCNELVILGFTVTIAREDCNLSGASFCRVCMPGATPISIRRPEAKEEKLASGGNKN
jgi:hypothetical protein